MLNVMSKSYYKVQQTNEQLTRVDRPKKELYARMCFREHSLQQLVLGLKSAGDRVKQCLWTLQTI